MTAAILLGYSRALYKIIKPPDYPKACHELDVLVEETMCGRALTSCKMYLIVYNIFVFYISQYSSYMERNIYFCGHRILGMQKCGNI